MAKSSAPKPRLGRDDPWLNSLRGAETIAVSEAGDGSYRTAFEGVDKSTQFPGGTWRTSVVLPVDLNLVDQHIDPLLALTLLADAATRIEWKMRELVNFCHSHGKTWSEIGRALGVSRQAAWERFSEED